MKLLAISGGPDSMHLLNNYKKSKIVVAHVNYNLRSNSNQDQKVVENFCKKHNLKLETLNVREKPKKNLENWAREIRYNFFAKIYQKHHCSSLLTAHHKDDFLETAIMQQRTNRFPSFFGIRKKITIKKMKVLRPYINLYWKKELLEELKKQKVSFVIDPSNSDLKFTRNAIREELSKLSLKEKNDQFKWFKMANKILIKKNKKVLSFYKRWEKLNFELSFFNDLKKFKEDLVFTFVHQNSQNVKLSSEKINSIVAFINAKTQNKKFILNDNNFLYKEKGHLLINQRKNQKHFNL